MYQFIAHGFLQEPGLGNYVIKPHYNMSNALNVLTCIAKVKLKWDVLKAIEDLNLKHLDQDNRELLEDYQRGEIRAIFKTFT